MSSDADARPRDAEQQLIRVLLKRVPRQIALPLSQQVTLSAGTKRIAIIKKNNEIALFRDKKGITVEIQGKEFSGESFSLQAADGQTITFEKRSYHGSLRFLADGADVLIINVLDIEDYLKGVLPAELGKVNEDSVGEAVKAFAITARTFAVNRIMENKKNYDVESTVSSQVFFSVESEKPFLNKLLEATNGKIIAYGGKPATVFFHSCCGGSTEDAANVFNSTTFPYLIAQKDGSPSNCRNAGVFSWTEAYSAAEFVTLLHAYDKRVDAAKEIASVQVPKKFPSGRAAGIEVTFTDSSLFSIPAKQIRLAIKRKNNSGILRSSLFTIDLVYTENQLESIIFRGNGNGHGVGLCQWGAFQLAKDGKAYDDILDFYFPGTTLKRLDEIN